MPQSKSLSIYIHVPFCERKCPYCHFFSQVGSEEDFNRYVKAILLEIDARRSDCHQRSIESIYFGGGTPFLIGIDRLCTILEAISSLANAEKAEVTIEANPNSTSKLQLQRCIAKGFNRLSIGVQSFNDSVLQTLRRPHTSQRNKAIVYEAMEAGFSNVSIDLMYDIPNMDLAIWEKSLREAVLLPVSHISIYNLEIEPNTAWHRIKRQIEDAMPSPDTSLKMYQLAQRILQDNSFQQYEISAFAKNSLRSHHNIGYWVGREFLGFGPGAFSYFARKRFSNSPNLVQYATMLEQGQLQIVPEEAIAPCEQLREFLAIGLRMNDGANFVSLQQQFDQADPNLLATIQRLSEIQLLIQNGEIVQLTDRGRLVYDSIASEIICTPVS